VRLHVRSFWRMRPNIMERCTISTPMLTLSIGPLTLHPEKTMDIKGLSRDLTMVTYMLLYND
jgi:hypothetical protein